MTEHSATTLRRWFWLAAVLLGAIQLWIYRYTPSSDDPISYLDIADAYLRGDWRAALNTHWSPLYSWLLGLAVFVFEPTPYRELAVVKVVDFLIYLGALAAFDFFLKALIEHHDRQLARDGTGRFLRVPDWVWVVSGYLLFIWSCLKWTGLFSDTPDLATSALVYLAAGLLLRGGSTTDSWLRFCLLGVVLGLGYLSKTALLPISLAFLAVAPFMASSIRRGLPRTIVAGLAVVAVAAPFVVTLSKKEGRVTFGDVGKYVYVLFVNPGYRDMPILHWQGERPEFGKPEHTTRKIYDSPAAFEFATPIRGTYPPWYEPSYWYAGIKIRFSAKRQAEVLTRNLVFAWTKFLGVLVLGYVVLVYGGNHLRASLVALKANAALLVPAATGLAAYLVATDLPDSDLPTQPAMRYITPFAVLLFAGVFSSVRLEDSKHSRRWLASTTLAALTFVGASLVANLVRDRLGPANREHVSWQIAEGLASLGLRPGDPIVMLGKYERTLYWARLAKVRIIAEIPNELDFWSLSPAARGEVLRATQKTGAKAVVTMSNHRKPDRALAEGWQSSGDDNDYVYLFGPS